MRPAARCCVPSLDRSTPGQLDWIDEARWPRRPWCSRHYPDGPEGPKCRAVVRPLAAALALPYIQANPPHMRFRAIFDCDQDDGTAAGAWLAADLPAPSWIAINRENVHAHVAYDLSAPVLMNGVGLHDGPVRLLAATEGAYRAALHGDISYAGPLAKNPWHPMWDTRWFPDPLDPARPVSYELRKLAEFVDIRPHWPKRGADTGEIGLGRNCTLFDRLRVWSYTAIRLYRGAGRCAPGAYIAWLNECYAQATAYNEFPKPLGQPEMRHVARSVARWVWHHDPAALAAFRERQAWKGRRSGAVRRAASENQRARVRIMRDEGASIRDIAAALEVGKSTVADWLSGEPKSGNSARRAGVRGLRPRFRRQE